MILHDSPLAHIHCPTCGREMRPGTACMVCTTAARLKVLGLTDPIARGGVVGAAAEASADELALAEAGLSLPVPGGRDTGPVDARGGRPRAPGPVRTRPARRRFKPIDIWKRYLPPVRLVWIFLLAIVWREDGFSSVAQAGPILAVLFVGVVTDLGFQRVRFPRLRVPDAALATSLFVAIIIWPASVGLAIVSIAVLSVGLRHLVRVNSHPWFNPAAVGITLATVVFGMSTSWHVGLTPVDALVVAVMGAVLIFRAPHTYRIAVGYFAAFLPLTAVLTLALGGGHHLLLLLEEGAIGPASVFFGVFMVTEPRTAPSSRLMMWAFAILVGVVAAALPVVFTEVPTLGAVGVLVPFLALFIGNLFTIVLPSARGARQTGCRESRPSDRADRPRTDLIPLARADVGRPGRRSDPCTAPWAERRTDRCGTAAAAAGSGRRYGDRASHREGRRGRERAGVQEQRRRGDRGAEGRGRLIDHEERREQKQRGAADLEEGPDAQVRVRDADPEEGRVADRGDGDASDQDHETDQEQQEPETTVRKVGRGRRDGVHGSLASTRASSDL